MTSFLSNLQTAGNLTRTENDAVTHRSSTDAVVDFFGLAGAMRNTPQKAVDLFSLAFQQDPQTAVRTLFYLRDVRGGQGEREIFRQCLNHLYDNYRGAYKAVVTHVPFYGRWDDIFHRGLTDEAADLIALQLDHDATAYGLGESVSLLAKWLPSENASSPKTKALARELIEAFELSPREYRQLLSALRDHIRLLETDMSRNNWDEISYDKLPSQAHRRHVKAFQRHTPERYQEYLDAVKAGEKKINVKSVYPHEIYNMVTKGETGYANVAWENLPDYTRGANALVMADVSGSMVRPHQPNNPIAVSVSLALYFAERNKGVFNNYFMTFSAQPQLVKVTGSTLQQRMYNISRAAWQQNTNLLAAFRAILEAGKNAREEMPKVLYVISDMEFDSATRGYGYTVETRMVPANLTWGNGGWNRQYAPQQVRVPVQPTSSDTVFETAKREYESYGLTLPHVVFWNVCARQTQAPALAQDGHVSLVSGLSPTVFGQAVEGKTPLELVHSVVNGERYERIVL